MRLARLLAAAAPADGRIAICDPMMNPAGKSAPGEPDLARRVGVGGGRVTAAETSGAALKLLESGAVPLAIVYASDMTGLPGLATVGTFPEETHPPIAFPAALMAASANAAAPAFLAFLRSPAAAAIFSGHGFARPR